VSRVYNKRQVRNAQSTHTPSNIWQLLGAEQTRTLGGWVSCRHKRDKGGFTPFFRRSKGIFDASSHTSFHCATTEGYIRWWGGSIGGKNDAIVVARRRMTLARCSSGKKRCRTAAAGSNKDEAQTAQMQDGTCSRAMYIS
jgi:hypothetical protein